MTLSELRCKFSLDLAKLILYINEYEHGRYSCAVDQVKRTQAEANANAKAGKGIKNSLHLIGLAADLLIYDHGTYLTQTDQYQFAGEFWEALDMENAWGGRFGDGNHFSRAYGGRK